MPAVPAVNPDTSPEPETNATVVLLLVQFPPIEASVRFVVKPVQTFGVPVMDAGDGFTVMTKVAAQLAGV